VLAKRFLSQKLQKLVESICRKFAVNRSARFSEMSQKVEIMNFRVQILSLFRAWASELTGRFGQRREGPKPCSPVLPAACQQAVKAKEGREGGKEKGEPNRAEQPGKRKRVGRGGSPSPPASKVKEEGWKAERTVK
jgi:hypothetical protein